MPEGAAHCWLVLSMLLISLSASEVPGTSLRGMLLGAGREGRVCRSSVNTTQLSLSTCQCGATAFAKAWSFPCGPHITSNLTVFPGYGLLAPSPFSPAWMLTQHQFLSLPGWHGGARPFTSLRAPGPVHVGEKGEGNSSWHSWSAPPPWTAERGWGLGRAYCQWCLFLLQ